MNIYILRKLKKNHTLICETFQTVYGVIYTEVNLGDRIELAHMLQNWVSTHVLRMNFLKKKNNTAQDFNITFFNEFI